MKKVTWMSALSPSERFMISAAEIASRNPEKVPELIRMAFEMNLDAAPAIAERLQDIARVAADWAEGGRPH